MARKNAALKRLAQKAVRSDTADLNARRQFLLTMAQSIGRTLLLTLTYPTTLHYPPSQLLLPSVPPSTHPLISPHHGTIDRSNTASDTHIPYHPPLPFVSTPLIPTELSTPLPTYLPTYHPLTYLSSSQIHIHQDPGLGLREEEV